MSRTLTGVVFVRMHGYIVALTVRTDKPRLCHFFDMVGRKGRTCIANHVLIFADSGRSGVVIADKAINPVMSLFLGADHAKKRRELLRAKVRFFV